MDNYPEHHALGRIDVITLEDRPALSRDVPLNLPSIQAGWPDFEHGFDSLKGRRMMGLVYGGSQIYRMCSTRLDRDADNLFGLNETVIPGGAYLRFEHWRASRTGTCLPECPLACGFIFRHALSRLAGSH